MHRGASRIQSRFPRSQNQNSIMWSDTTLALLGTDVLGLRLRSPFWVHPEYTQSLKSGDAVLVLQMFALIAQFIRQSLLAKGFSYINIGLAKNPEWDKLVARSKGLDAASTGTCKAIKWRSGA